MRSVVRERWLEFTDPLEGGAVTNYPYADIRGLITTAYGVLLDPMSMALGLPWLDATTGQRATRQHIASAWQAVKNDPQARIKGHTYARRLTTLRLTEQAMADLALSKLDDFDVAMRARYADWDDYGACVQLALLSLCWACGSSYHFPRLDEAVRAQDWDACSVHIQMRETTPEGVVNAGLKPRNVRNRTLMLNAERVRGFHLDPDVLEWSRPIDVSEETTQPELPRGTVYPAPLPEEVTGSGGTIHVGAELYRLDVEPPDDVA